MHKILIAEDDNELRDLFVRVLSRYDYEVHGVSDGEEALSAIKNEYFDLLISDIMMPRRDGYSLLRALREAKNTTPALLITAKDAFDDMRRGFLLGGDDYMIKPVNINEMVLRVQALIRRAEMQRNRTQSIGSTHLDSDSLTVTRDGKSQILPQKEFMLLYKMASYPGKIFSRMELMEDIWGYENETDTHTVDVHIGRLRDRFRDNSDFEIITIRGVGYKVVKA